MKKVLCVITNGLKKDGITGTQIEYVRHISFDGLSIDMAAVHNDLPEIVEQFEELGCKVIKFPDRYRHLLRYCKQLYEVLNQNQYDVVHVHGSSAILVIELFIAKLAGVKSRIVHSRNTYCKFRLLDKILRPLFYKTYTLALACGKDAGDFLFPNRPFSVLHNGKDFDKFQFSEMVRERIRINQGWNGKTVLGFVGNLNEQKNPEFLIEIIKGLSPEFLLVLIGDGPKRSALEKSVHDLGLNSRVVFFGRVDNVHEIIQGIDIMLLPSFYEGLPNVVLEWQISGLPCFVSNNVTRECKVMDSVHFLSISEGIDLWIKNIRDCSLVDPKRRTVLSREACIKMKDEGFEINSSAQRLREFYFL